MTDTHERFDQWVKDSGLRRDAVAARLLVSTTTLWNWTTGKVTPKGPARLAIEYLTDGQIGRDQW